MSDPKLKKTSVAISYKSNDGYSMTTSMKAGDGCFHLKTHEPIPPEHALLEGIEELARLTALFGFREEAERRVNDAFERVAKSQAARAQKQ